MATKRDLRQFPPAQDNVAPPDVRGARQDRISDAGRHWQMENAEAAEAWAAWVEKNGVPLAKYRQF